MPVTSSQTSNHNAQQINIASHYGGLGADNIPRSNFVEILLHQSDMNQKSLAPAGPPFLSGTYGFLTSNVSTLWVKNLDMGNVALGNFGGRALRWKVSEGDYIASFIARVQGSIGNNSQIRAAYVVVFIPPTTVRGYDELYLEFDIYDSPMAIEKFGKPKLKEVLFNGGNVIEVRWSDVGLDGTEEITVNVSKMLNETWGELEGVDIANSYISTTYFVIEVLNKSELYLQVDFWDFNFKLSRLALQSRDMLFPY